MSKCFLANFWIARRELRFDQRSVTCPRRWFVCALGRRLGESRQIRELLADDEFGREPATYHLRTSVKGSLALELTPCRAPGGDRRPPRVRTLDCRGPRKGEERACFLFDKLFVGVGCCVWWLGGVRAESGDGVLFGGGTRWKILVMLSRVD